jgi:CheY-like chemotaxis protein
VVEDDAEMRAYVCDCLRPLALRLVEASDGQDALEQIVGGLGDDLALVVTDLYMPRIDGRALRERLHADRRWASLPVLLITGEAARTRDGPALRKPFNARSLQAAVQGLLPRSNRCLFQPSRPASPYPWTSNATPLLPPSE